MKLKGKEKKTKNRIKKSSEEEEEYSEKENTPFMNTLRLYYNGLYLESVEGWISCQICGK